MKHLFFAIISISLLGLMSCKDDPKEGTLTLHFKAVYDGQPLQTFTTHPFDNGQQIQLSHMSMFISDLELAQGSTTRNLKDVELVDLSYDNLASAEAGYTLSITGIPAGTYDGIQFGVGVPADLNAMNPSDFSSSSPLSKTGYYWDAWQSYIFSKTEGRLDTVGNGLPELGFALHVGSDALYRVLQAPIPLTIEDGKSLNVDVIVDYRLLLQGIDIKSNPQNHSPSDVTNITALVNNMASAFSLAF